MKKFIKVSVLALAASLIANTKAVFAQDKPFDGQSVNVGIVAGPAEEVWKVVQEKAKEDGIDLKLTLFTDYIQPNEALKNGDLDLNAFQHIAYLDNWNEGNGADLTPIGFTFVSPMGTYSEKIKSLDELTEGATIAIPNDPTNGGRALLALELAGVIEVDDKAGILATVNDITKNEKNIKIQELDAAQIAAVLKDVDAAVINTNFAKDAGLSLKDAIFVDADYPEKLSEKYKNVIATQAENKENDLYLQIVKYYQTEEVAQKIFEVSGGDKPIWEGAPVFED